MAEGNVPEAMGHSARMHLVSEGRLWLVQASAEMAPVCEGPAWARGQAVLVYQGIRGPEMLLATLKLPAQLPKSARQAGHALVTPCILLKAFTQSS